MPSAAFAKRLLSWWDRHGRKDLPWQQLRTPYRVWVSEIMLQQTQVGTVIPYFERFIERFPDIQALADSDLDEVLALWSGLGYYARARNLHKAAGIAVSRHGGELPADSGQLSDLPGIGESTANAILSQAWNIPAAVVDGNVRRVLARHDKISGWVGEAAARKAFWKAAESRLPGKRGADYTQAIMDLGAVLCTRGNPACDDCPVHADCGAFKSGTTNRYPETRPPPKISRKTLHMLIMTNDDNQVLLERRPPAGIWGGLWSLPDNEDEKELAGRFGLDAGEFRALPEINHRLTHMQIRIRPWLARFQARAQGVECHSGQRWFGFNEWPGAGLPKPVLSLLTRHHQEERHDAHG